MNRTGRSPEMEHGAAMTREGAAPAAPCRKRPPHGVLTMPNRPIIVFVTACAKDRIPWLACEKVHSLLRTLWADKSAWCVGRYVLMPDHLHLLASPATHEFSLEKWMRFWKAQFSRRHGNPSHCWQYSHWDRRLRSEESYEEKWEYVRNNPVRKGLVANAEQWPYQGEIHELEWR